MAQVAVVGGGAFGTALAGAVLRNGHSLLLWTRKKNDRESPLGLQHTSEYAAVASAELIFIAVPSPYVEATCRALCPHLDGRHLMVHVSRGLLGDTLTPISQVMERETPVRRVGVLAGPLSAQILSTDAPGGAVVGSPFPDVIDAVRDALQSESLRVFSTTDMVGVEVASAMVGLLALGAGFAMEAGFDAPSLAVFLTQGMVEANRLGRVLGTEDRTFRGLAGFGDLLAAVAGDDRPEVRLGRALAQGQSLSRAVKDAGAHIEGVRIAERVASFGNDIGLATPISGVMAEVLRGRMSPADAVRAWMQ